MFPYYPSINHAMAQVDASRDAQLCAMVRSAIGATEQSTTYRVEAFAAGQTDSHGSFSDDLLPPPPYTVLPPLTSSKAQPTFAHASSHRHCTTSTPTKPQRQLLLDRDMSSWTDKARMPSVNKSVPGNDDAMPPLLLEMVMGHKLAVKMTQKRNQRRQVRLEEVHDAWAALGLDTRELAADPNASLPPHFWDPPRYDAEEMNRRLASLAL